jgi:hypothetical protein
MLFAVYDLLGDLEDDMSVGHHLSSITADHATRHQMCKPSSCLWPSELPGAVHVEAGRQLFVGGPLS